MFGTSGIRGPFGETITADLALAVGQALASAGNTRVVVGRDPRLTGELLVDALTAGLRECGADVIDIGHASTPTLARSVGWQDADAGVAVTASHNPPADNGIKLWNPSGMAFDTDQREQMRTLITEGAGTPAAWDDTGTRQQWTHAAQRHVQAITEAVSLPEPLDVVVDVGSGMGGVTVDALRELGCHVETLNETPDGHFPARPSEPTAEHCETLRTVVANTDAELGIAHDGDADRMLAVDETGTFLPGDVLLALFARQAAADGDRVAVPVNTSLAVDDALAAVGATADRTPVGDVFVAEHASTTPDVVFGGEPSGAWIWPDRTLCPDGPLAAAKLAALVATAGPLSEQAATIDQYPLRRESVPVEDKQAVMAGVRQRAHQRFPDIETIDGVRIDTGDGWLLVRASGTEPVVRITAQAREPERATELQSIGQELIADSTATTD